MLSVEFWVVFKVVFWVVGVVWGIYGGRHKQLSIITQTNITPNGVFKLNYLIINTIILNSNGVQTKYRLTTD
jgi:hypothetical protein